MSIILNPAARAGPARPLPEPEPAMANTVLLEVSDEIATLRLNRPEVLNALSVEMMEDLARALRALSARRDYAVVVVEGAGPHFMAGGDINDFARHLGLSPESRLASFRAMIEQYINPAVTTLQGLHAPVICKVRGACAGFGLSLMLACDLVLCADNAKFTSAYAAIGLSAMKPPPPNSCMAVSMTSCST